MSLLTRSLWQGAIAGAAGSRFDVSSGSKPGTTTDPSMPMTSATEAASSRSCRVEQYSSSSSSSQFFMNSPTTS